MSFKSMIFLVILHGLKAQSTFT